MGYQSGGISLPGSRTLRSQSWSGVVSVSTYPMVFMSGNWARNSLVTPGFRVKRETGRLPENAFGYSETVTTGMYGWERQVSPDLLGRGNNLSWNTGTLASWTLDVPPSTTMSAFNAENHVRAKLIEQIRDVDLDIGVLAGEGKETLRMLADIAQKLRLAIQMARERNAPGIWAALGMGQGGKSFANYWLMVNYGIQPFLRDLYASAKALERGLIKEEYKMARDRHKLTDQKVLVPLQGTGPGRTLVWNIQLEVSGRVKYRVSNPLLATLASFGVLNPATIAWELKRLSFVVDWLVGVGAWLGQLDSSFAKTFEYGSITVFTKVIGVKTWDTTEGWKPTPYTTSYRNVQGRYESVTVNRKALTGMPTIWFPPIADPTSLSHAITSLALLRQSWSGMR